MENSDKTYYKCKKGNCANLINNKCVIENPNVIKLPASHGSSSIIVSCKSYKLLSLVK